MEGEDGEKEMGLIKGKEWFKYRWDAYETGRLGRVEKTGGESDLRN